MHTNQPLKKIEFATNIEISYQEVGNRKPTILFLHGMASDHSTWQTNVIFLKDYFHCIVPDLPGYGLSSFSGKNSTLDFYCDQIIYFINELKLNRIILAGHSMGAQLAVKIFLKNPELISHLILIAPSGFEKFTRTERAWLKNLYQPDLLEHIPLNEYIKSLKNNFNQTKDNLDHNFIQNQVNLYHSKRYSQYCQTISSNVSSMLDNPIFEDLPKINIPTLVIFGKLDNMIPNRILHPHFSLLKIAQDGACEISGSQLMVLDSAGHFVHWDQSNLVNKAILNYIH